MIEPPRSSLDDLWQRLADAQDAAIAGGGSATIDVPSARPPSARAVRRRLRWGALVMVAGAAAGVALYVSRAPLRVQLGRGGQQGTPGETLVADARSDLPLLFSDGSTVTFRAGAAGRMQRLTAAGAELEIDCGRLEAHVVHAASTLWLVHAGPYRVRVTGTRFSVDWVSPRLNVAVYEGSVVVDGGALGAGIPLRAGQHLTVSDGAVRTEPLTAHLADQRLLAARAVGDANAAGPSSDAALKLVAPVDLATDEDGPAGVERPVGGVGAAGLPNAHGESRTDSVATTAADEGDETRVDDSSPATGTVSSTAAAAKAGKRARTKRSVAVTARHQRAAAVTSGDAPGTAPAAHDQDWLPLAEQGQYAEALEVARRAGWAGLCARLDARRLLMLGDVARYAGAPEEARQAFKALVRRFPDGRLAGDAVFSLGRLAFEADRARAAATWFRLYVNRWPGGPLADQALGRLLECSVRMKDDTTARSVSRDYLARAPHGPHASLANKVLRGRARESGIEPSVEPSGER